MLASRYLCLGWLKFYVPISLWQCLCWMYVLSLGFCCSLWLFGKSGGCMLPPMKFFCDTARCGHQGFLVNVLLGIRSWHIGMRLVWGQRWGPAKGFHRKEENRMLHEDLLSPLEMDSESEESPTRQSATELEMRPGDWTQRRGWTVKTQLAHLGCHTYFSGRLELDCGLIGWVGWEVSREDLSAMLEMGAERRVGLSRWSATRWGWERGMDWRRGRFPVSLPASLAGVALASLQGHKGSVRADGILITKLTPKPNSISCLNSVNHPGCESDSVMKECGLSQCSG